jgi:catechol 2,3-dioxygenase-like lactoylglutathione lyase family enzyme/uncharacterized protein YndB with AHSA1/START domain
MPLTSVTTDTAKRTLTVVGNYPVPQKRLWDAFADPRQLERFWGPPAFPATFTCFDFKVGGRAEYFLALPDGKRWTGSWQFTALQPIRSFEACDGDPNAEDPNMPASMRFAFETTPTGSRLTIVTWFSSIEAMEQTVPGMEEGLRAAVPQLDAVIADREMTMTLTVESLDHLVINVRDVEQSAAWYLSVLGMSREDSQPTSGEKPRTSLKFGRQKINLRPVTEDKGVWFTAQYATAGSEDLCFITETAPDVVVEHLRSHGIAVEEGPVQKHGARGVILSVYCRDPDGNLIEISSYADR